MIKAKIHIVENGKIVTIEVLFLVKTSKISTNLILKRDVTYNKVKKNDKREAIINTNFCTNLC